MPRKGSVPKRDILPDPIYNDKRVSKLVNFVMMDGKKGLAQTIVYGAFDIIEDKTDENAIDVFGKAVENTMPLLEVKARRVGGANYQVPVEVRPDRRLTLALRWIVRYARERSEHSMKERLANELIDASNETGNAYKHKVDIHRAAEANRAFAHYRW